jgi:hypothetical protein
MTQKQDIFVRAYAVVTRKKIEPPAKYPYLAEKHVGQKATATILEAQHVQTSSFNGIVLTVRLRNKKFAYSLPFAKPDMEAIRKQLESDETDDWIGKRISFATKKGSKRNGWATTVTVLRAGKARNAHRVAVSKWSEHVLVFDTETRITADQLLTFGVYRLCTLVGDRYRATEEGIFYADDLPAKERRILKSYTESAVSDVKSFPPRFPLYTRSEFLKRVFWPAIRRHGTSVCGLNLPFDLSRLALDWNKGDDNEWSLTMAQYPNGTDNKNYPHVLIKPLDSKKAFIRLAKPWKPKKWKNVSKSYFLDLRTLAWALFNQSFSLKTLCEELKTEHQKTDHEPTGLVTLKEIEYARQDVRCTVDVVLPQLEMENAFVR